MSGEKGEGVTVTPTHCKTSTPTFVKTPMSNQSFAMRKTAYVPPYVRKVEQKQKPTPDLNLNSETAYPSLGSKPAAPPKIALNFKKTVEETAAREAAVTAQKAPVPVKKAAAPSSSAFRRYIPSHCYDDGPQDDEVEIDEPYEEAEEDADEGEFNAHLESGRRRGDKGIW
jgi:hypothetical protein